MSDLTAKYQSKMPGVYIEEISAGSNPIVGVGTSTAVFIGNAVGGSDEDKNKPKLITSWNEFTESYQDEAGKSFADGQYLPYAVYCFFNEGGTRCYVVNLDCPGEAYTYQTILTDSFMVQKQEGDLDNEELSVTVSNVDEETRTFILTVTTDDQTPVETLTINFDELDLSFSDTAGIKDSDGQPTKAINVELKRAASASPMPIFDSSKPLTLAAPTATGTFTGIGPSVFVRRTSSTNQDSLSVKLGETVDNYTLTVRTKNENDENVDTDPLPITQTEGDEFVKLNTPDGTPEIEYKFLTGTTPDTTPPEGSEEGFVSLPTTASCEEKNLALVFENLKKVDDINIIAFPDMVVGSDDYAEPYIQLGYEYCYARKYCFLLLTRYRMTIPYWI